ncbi:MAG: YdcF family protein [Vallitaleaceae bacterium]|nr:YdcF family protein [Vallitaleaceae bacterium]
MIALRLLSAFCLIYFVSLVKLRGGAGFQWLWLVIGIASGLLSLQTAFRWFFSNRWVNAFLIFCLVFFFVVELFIIVGSRDSKSTIDCDYLIVLGAGVRGTVPTLILKNRLDKAYDYLVEHPNTIAIVSGGQGKGENITEAAAMSHYLLEKGIEDTRIIRESMATNTNENIANSYAIVREVNQDATLAVVTTRFHLFRAKLIARNQGLQVNGYGADTYWPLIPNYYLREFFGVMKDWLF